MNIIYAGKITAKEEHQLTISAVKETFKEAIELHWKLVANQKRIAYFFIDPLLHSFEAANQFYFEVFECDTIDKLNTYKSGASPIQALSDAKELINAGLYDLVMIFGYEPLLSNKRKYGKEEVTKAMSIFESYTIIQSYNEIAHQLCIKLGISKDQFRSFADQLFQNYHQTYERLLDQEVPSKRGRQLDDMHADLFKLTDCANPNIDFSGGLILANEETSNLLGNSHRITVSGVKYVSVKGTPHHIDEIVSKNGTIFPHLKEAFLKATDQSAVDVVREFKNRNLYLEVYTCYPPIPTAFLLASGLIENIDELPQFLQQYEVTITGGMNFARAPWNNPSLNALIDMYFKLKETNVKYGMVHGNGGIGEIQGVAILEDRSINGPK